MIFDKIENLDRYKEFADYAEQIKHFIEKDKKSICPKAVMNWMATICLHWYRLMRQKTKKMPEWKHIKNMQIFSLWKKERKEFISTSQMNSK